MTDIAPLAYQVDTSDIVKATSDLDKHAAAASKTDKSAAALISSMASVARAMGVVVNAVNANNQALTSNSKALKSVKSDTDSVDSSVDRLAASYNALRSSLDPVFAASKSYEAALETVNSALSRGVISQTEANRVLAMAESRFLTAGQNAMVAGQQIVAANHHITNMGFQLQDIGVMLAAGQSPLMLAMQQGTQVAGIFNQMKAEGQSAFAALRGGMSALLGPTTLITVGVIAAGAALTQWAMSALGAGKNAKTLTENLDDLTGAISEYQAGIMSGTELMSGIREEFGAFSNETVALAERIQDLRLREIMIQSHDAVVQLTSAFSGGFRSELARLVDLFAELEYTGEQSAHSAKLMADQLQRIREAKGPREQLAALRDMDSLFVSLVGGIDNMNNEQREYYNQILQSQKQLNIVVSLTDDAASATNGWAGTMAGVRIELNAIAAVIASLGGGAIQAAAKRTELSALKAGASIKDAAIAASEFQENLKIDAQVAGLESRFGIAGKAMGVLVRGQAEYNRSLDRQLDAEREIAIERERAEAVAARKGRGGGKGGGAANRIANERARELEALVESLLTERQIVEQWNNEQLELINQYTDAELMAIGGRNGAKLRLEMEYQEKLRAIHQEEAQRRISDASGLFGALAQIAAAGGEKTVKAVAAFQAIEGTINAYGAAIKALNTPGISLAGRFAAYASVLAAGLKGVAAIKSAGSGGSGGGSGGGAPSSVSGTTPTSTPTRSVMVSFDGPDWWRQMAESMMTQIYDQTADGTRVVFER